MKKQSHKTSATASEKDAIQLLKEDHLKVKKLFEQFEKAKKDEDKDKIVRECIAELKVHTKIEEELFYPEVEGSIEEGEHLIAEAEEEHHVVDLLIAELEKMRAGDDHFEEKFLVLAENVRHHIKEEEGEVFPEVKKTDIDLEALGEEMAQRKQELASETRESEE